MKKRTKTMQAVVDKVNAFLETSSTEQREAREQMAALLSSLLMEAGCYRGFNYIYWLETGCAAYTAACLPEGLTGPEKDAYVYGPSGDRSHIRYY